MARSLVGFGLCGEGEKMTETNKIKGKRRRGRAEIKGDPYEFIFKSGINQNDNYAKIIELIFDVRVASTSQIKEYLGLSSTAVRKYLQYLYENNFLYRIFPKVEKGSSEGYYFLDSMGAFYLAAVNEVAKRDFPWSQKENLIGIDKLQHTLGITQVRIALEQSEEIEVTKFYGEKRTGRREFTDMNDRYVINPDAEINIRFQVDGKKFARVLLLEYDRGTEELFKIREKLDKYIKYYGSSEFKQCYDNYPALVILSDGETSERRFTAAIEERKIELQEKKISVYFSSYGDFLTNPAGEIFTNYRLNKKDSLIKRSQ